MTNGFYFNNFVGGLCYLVPGHLLVAAIANVEAGYPLPAADLTMVRLLVQGTNQKLGTAG